MWKKRKSSECILITWRGDCAYWLNFISCGRTIRYVIKEKSYIWQALNWSPGNAIRDLNPAILYKHFFSLSLFPQNMPFLVLLFIYLKKPHTNRIGEDGFFSYHWPIYVIINYGSVYFVIKSSNSRESRSFIISYRRTTRIYLKITYKYIHMKML